MDSVGVEGTTVDFSSTAGVTVNADQKATIILEQQRHVQPSSQGP